MEELITDWTHIVPGAIRIPLTAYKYRHALQMGLKKFQVFVGAGKTNILITGLPSSGKTVLSSAIANEIDALKWQKPPGSRSVETKTIPIGGWTKIVRVIPGQGYKEREKGLHEALLMHDKLEGIIHVVDWGYNKTRDLVVEQNEIREGIDSIQKLRERNLQEELKEFAQVCSRIKTAHFQGKGPKWLVIAVNKCDLYKSDLNVAQKYYHPEMNSKFVDIINDLETNVGKAHIKILTLPICSYEENFKWGDEVVLTSIGGAEYRAEILKSFLLQLAMLR